MEPRPNGRGNSQWTWRVPALSTRLQWSPDQTAGETSTPPRKGVRRTCFKGAPTKRPGKPGAPRGRPAGGRASMEPRPNGRGNVILCMTPFAEDMLQWSPDQTAGETHSIRVVGTPERPASMEPRPNGRGNLVSEVVQGRGELRASMEPRPNGRGNKATRVGF